MCASAISEWRCPYTDTQEAPFSGRWERPRDKSCFSPSPPRSFSLLHPASVCVWVRERESVCVWLGGGFRRRRSNTFTKLCVCVLGWGGYRETTPSAVYESEREGLYAPVNSSWWWWWWRSKTTPTTTNTSFRSNEIYNLKNPPTVIHRLNHLHQHRTSVCWAESWDIIEVVVLDKAGLAQLSP